VYGAEAVLADLERGDEPLTFAAACRERILRKNGKPPALSQLHRWHDPGIQRVRLEAARVGGARVTTKAALIRFSRRLSGAEPRSAPVERRALDATEAEKLLNRAGL
jgi:hypothetical protein